MKVMKDRKTLDVTDMDDLAEKVAGVKVYGNPGAWRLLCKASSDDQAWMKSTKAMEVPGLGVLVQVSTQQDDHVAEALCFIGGATIVEDPQTKLLVLAQADLVRRFSAAVEDMMSEKEARTAKEKMAAKKVRGRPRRRAVKIKG